jgi:WD40 repeat protein
VGEPLRHGDTVSSAQFSPDGQWVVTASDDETARVWEAATGKPVGEPMRHEADESKGIEAEVLSAQFSPDGRWVVTASEDKTARVWEAATGKPVGEPMRHEGRVSSAQFSPDGRWVVTASRGNTAQVWPFADYSPSADVTALAAAGEYCGGFTLDPESHFLRPLSGPERAELRRRLMEMRQDPLYGNLVRWIVDPPDQRPAGPFMDKAARSTGQPAK